MKKLKLHLEDLPSTSFDTTPAEKPKGTVFGEQCTCYTQCTCPGCPTCYASCNGTCDVSCGATCDAVLQRHVRRLRRGRQLHRRQRRATTPVPATRPARPRPGPDCECMTC